jgi:hypothetical protein
MVGNRYHRAKKDKNHNDIAAVFIEYGYDVIDLSALKNLCDFVAYNGKDVYFVEVKSKGGRLTDGEITFIVKHPYVKIIDNLEQAETLAEKGEYKMSDKYLAQIKRHQTAKELYVKETGRRVPDNVIEYNEWMKDYVKWLEEKLVISIDKGDKMK